jgi:DNA repair exonuclease SbcCD nuclease subunit
MRVVFCSDSHLGFDYPIREASARRGEDFFVALQQVLDYARRQADVLIHAGDLFH